MFCSIDNFIYKFTKIINVSGKCINITLDNSLRRYEANIPLFYIVLSNNISAYDYVNTSNIYVRNTNDVFTLEVDLRITVGQVVLSNRVKSYPCTMTRKNIKNGFLIKEKIIQPAYEVVLCKKNCIKTDKPIEAVTSTNAYVDYDDFISSRESDMPIKSRKSPCICSGSQTIKNNIVANYINIKIADIQPYSILNKNSWGYETYTNSEPYKLLIESGGKSKIIELTGVKYVWLQNSDIKITLLDYKECEIFHDTTLFTITVVEYII